MKKQALILMLCSMCYILHANTQPNQQELDSVINIMKNQSIPLIDRYYMTGDIGSFSTPQQITILKTLIPEAKEYEDKAVVTRLYSVIANHYVLTEQMEEAKSQLDSAFQYKDQFNNNAISGLMYYAAGHYYHNVNDIKKAHENYYESSKYLETLPSRPPLLSSIYYNLALIYVLWGDENRLKELVEEMKKVPVYFPNQPMLNNWVVAEYFNVQYHKYNQPALLDSAIKYNQEAVELCNESELNISDKHQLSQNYISLVRAYIQKKDIKTAQKNLAQVEKFINKERWATLMQLNVLKGEYYVAIKEYNKAEEVLNKALDLLSILKEEQKMDFYEYYLEIYDNLAHINEEQKNYEAALTYEKKSLEYRKQGFNRENSTIVNDLRAKYNLDQQERIVNQLTLLSERRKNINILAVAVLILFLVVIIQLIIRFRVNKRANENKLKLERMQSYLEGMETTRERLSKELHDNISNELMALKMRILQSEKPENIVENLSQIQAEVRAVSHDLLPPVFQHAHFTEVLYSYISQWNELSRGTTGELSYKAQLNLEFTPEDESWDKLPDDVSLGLYRIIQEAVGNTLKHAEATMVDISLNREADTITLTIQDNGKGFEVQESHNGIGLKLIRERAKGLNGHATLQSTPGKGTKIEVSVKA